MQKTYTGTKSPDEYFFLKAFKIKLILYIHALLVFTFFGCLVAEKNKFWMQKYSNTHNFT
jgi:hypothetical protein